jgi:hypothetical protein
MLIWFESHREVYWWLVCAVICVQLFFMLRSFLRPSCGDIKKADWWWGCAILGLLVAGRWPSWWLSRVLNADENFLIAGANTLRHDPIFWRSVDGGTSGPLNFYALLPIGSILGFENHLAARITATLLLALALTFAYQTLAVVFGRPLARICIFPVTCVEALSLDTDYLHYSTELVSICLLAGAFYLFTRRVVVGPDRRRNVIAGFALGAVPWAKLQGAPIAVALGIFWLIWELFPAKRLAPGNNQNGAFPLVLGALAPAFAGALFLTAYGLWPYVIVSYFENNVAYAGTEGPTLYSILGELWKNADYETSLLTEWGLGTLLLLVLLLPLGKTVTATTRVLSAAVVVYLLASLVSVLWPHRPFLHYTQFAIVPWTLFVGFMVGQTIQNLSEQNRVVRCALLSATMLCGVGGVLYARADQPGPETSRLAGGAARTQSLVARELKRYTHKGDSLAVWGWMSHFHVETGLPQAARRSVTSSEISEGPLRDYYRQIYLEDLTRSEPAVFVDATGPGNFAYNSRDYSFERIFPALTHYIHLHYVLAGEVQSCRIYVRNDRWTALMKPQPESAHP